MQFLSPIWFLGLLALGIPILIHLIHQNQKRIFKIGSISLWENLPFKNHRNWSLRDLFLLLVRCALLLILILFLANAIWPRSKTHKSLAWILIPRANYPSIYTYYKKKIDSLVNSGGEIHFLDSSFTLADTINHFQKNHSYLNDTLEKKLEAPDNYFYLAKRLEYRIPLGAKAFFFTDNLKAHFRGSKPDVHYPIFWDYFNPYSRPIQKLIKAWRGPKLTIHALKILSQEKGTWFFPITIHEEAILYPYSLKYRSGGDTLSHFNEGEIHIDTGTFNIALFGEKNKKDVLYLESAIKSGSPLFPSSLHLDLIYSDLPSSKTYDWIFWLKKELPPKNIFDYTKNLFVYFPGKDSIINSWIIPGNFDKNIFGREQINLFRFIPIRSGKEASTLSQLIPTGKTLVWTDGYGHPLLVRENHKEKIIYRFYSRFDPQWNDLVWSESFPRWFWKLFTPLPSLEQIEKLDQRSISGELSISATRNLRGDLYTIHEQGIPIDIPLAFIFLLLFLLERVLSHRN